MRRQNATKHPEWMRTALILVILVGLALTAPLFLGILFDLLTHTKGLGLLFGMLAGVVLATIIVFRIVQSRYLVIAPDSDEEKGES